MNLRRIKNSAELVLDGIAIDAEYHDKNLKTLTLTDASGHVLKIEEEYSSLKALVPSEPAKETKIVVAGTVCKVPVREVFDDNFAASQRKYELEAAGAEVEVKTEEIEIPF